MRDNEITVGIVLFKPNYERLQESLKAIAKQFDNAILYNNGECDLEKIYEIKPDDLNIKILGNGVNVGIAAGLNSILEEAVLQEIDWVITLDQDSVIPDNMRIEYEKWINNTNAAIIAPQCIDFRRKYRKVKDTPGAEKVPACITSGSCMNCKIWSRLGKFDEWLFIGLVDNDYCRRAYLSGYDIIRLNHVVLDHQYGSIAARPRHIEEIFLRAGKLLNNEHIANLSLKREVDPLRVYYGNRNRVYLKRKFKKYGGIGYGNHHCRTWLGFLIASSLPDLLAGKNKVKILNAIVRGIMDGYQKEVTPWCND